MKSPYWNFNANTGNLNCNTWSFWKNRGVFSSLQASQTWKKRAFRVERPASLLQRYDISEAKARNVKTAAGADGGTLWQALALKNNCGLGRFGGKTYFCIRNYRTRTDLAACNLSKKC